MTGKLTVFYSLANKCTTGEPKEEWDKVVELLRSSGKTEEEIAANPLLAKDILYPSSTPIDVSSPKQARHDFGLRVNKEGKLEGHPADKWEKVLAALKAKGIDINEAQKDPAGLAKTLYELDMDTVFGVASPPSSPQARGNKLSEVKELKRNAPAPSSVTLDKRHVDQFLFGLLIALGFLFIQHLF